MSDGGKGSRPRPYSVSQDEYAKRWEAIFHKDGLSDNQKKEVDAVQETNYNKETKTAEKN